MGIKRLLIGLFLTSFTILQAQRSLSFDELSMKDGLSSGKANCFIQDKRGFIWIGTWNGLNRYDGYQFKTYTSCLSDSTSLSNKEIVSLLESKDGYIWIGTTSGLNRLDPMTDEITVYPFHNQIICLHEDESSRIWAGTFGGGLYILDPKTGSQEHYFGNSVISDICEYTQDSYWIASYNGLIEFNPTNSFYRVYLPSKQKNSITNSTVTQVKKDHKGIIWISSWGGGIDKLIIDPQSKERKFINYQNNPDNNNSICSNAIFRLLIDDENNIWCGTWNNGLIFFPESSQNLPPKEATFSCYENNIIDHESLSGNNISALFIDRLGVLWVGAQNVNYCSVLKANSRLYKTQYFNNGLPAYTSVRSLLSTNNYLWVGTTVDLQLYEHTNSGFKLKKKISPSYVFNNYLYQSSSILALAKNKYGLWVGTDDAGLILYPNNFEYNNSKKPIRYFNTLTSKGQLPGNKINNVILSKKDPNTIWVSTMYHGVARLTYDGKDYNSKFFFQGSDDFHLSNNNVRTLFEDKDGIIWIGTQDGLNALDPQTNKIDKYFFSSNNNSINSNTINCIFESSRGELWIGSNSGLNKKINCNGKDNESICFKNYLSLKRLGNDIIWNIIEDNNGQLWIKPYKGLINFTPYSERPIKDYLTKEYLSLSTDNNAACVTEDGTLCFGDSHGFIAFHPDSVTNKSLAPKVCITDIQIMNKSLSNNEERHQLAAPFVKELELTHKDKALTIVFSAMDYKNPKRNHYAYYLEGHDDTWNELGFQNYVTLNNLSAGNYIFHVKACNSDGSWSENTASLSIRIYPPWNKTILAYIIYVLLIIALLYFFNKYSVIRIKEKSRLMLEVVKSEKEHKLNDLKTLFFTDITHEFRTPLTLIQGPTEEILRQEELPPYVKDQANLILRNTNRLLRLVNQLMDFRKVDRGKMTIIYQKCNINELFKDVYESYIGVAKSRSIDFTIDIPKNDIIAYLDTDKIEKSIYNLVSNAFKYSDDGGKICLSIIKTEDCNNSPVLIIEVEDEGIGIADKDQERVFERFVQTHQKSTHSTGGIGLYLSKMFIEQHGGSIDLESELGQGSCFRITLPYKQLEDLNDEIVNNEENLSNEKRTTVSLTSILPQDSNSINYQVNQNFENTILVVDDDFDLNTFIVNSLSLDYNVICAYNGIEGLELAKKHSPNIIITDVMMPEMDGFELCNQLREDVMTSHIPVIFLTAKTLEEDQLQGLELGAVDYITKPFNMVTLKHKIKNVIETKTKVLRHYKKNVILEPEVEQLSSLDDKFLKKAVEAVENNLDDTTFDVDKFSQVIGLSSNQAYRKIKALTGQTAKEFIRNQRLKTAASLFLQKRRSISEVIYMVGFSSPSYFTRCFKEYYNCTPKEYIAKDGIIDDIDQNKEE